jgi:hypothetical protein
MLQWYLCKYRRFPRKNSAKTNIYRLRTYLKVIQVRMERGRAIVSGPPQRVSSHHHPTRLSGKRGR